MSTKCDAEKLAPQHKSAFFSFIKVCAPILRNIETAMYALSWDENWH
jgi:hypothetical protein